MLDTGRGKSACGRSRSIDRRKRTGMSGGQRLWLDCEEPPSVAINATGPGPER
jgi:hypothetical protein